MGIGKNHIGTWTKAAWRAVEGAVATFVAVYGIPNLIDAFSTHHLAPDLAKSAAGAALMGLIAGAGVKAPVATS